jgi:hypothetical protein
LGWSWEGKRANRVPGAPQGPQSTIPPTRERGERGGAPRWLDSAGDAPPTRRRPPPAAHQGFLAHPKPPLVLTPLLGSPLCRSPDLPLLGSRELTGGDGRPGLMMRAHGRRRRRSTRPDDASSREEENGGGGRIAKWPAQLGQRCVASLVCVRAGLLGA